MNDEEFEREVRDAAQRVAGGRATDTLHVRVAAVPAADRRRVASGSRFRTGFGFVAFAAAIVVAAAVVVAAVVVVVGPGLTLLATRTNDPTVAAGSPGATQIAASPVTATAAATASPDGSAPVTRDLGRLSVTMPAGWQVVWPRVWIAPMGPLVFLSNAPIADPCPTAFSSGDACQKPLAALPPDGILVTIGGSAVSTPSDASHTVTSRPVTPTCAALGGERALGAAFAGRVITACLRGPDFATNEAAFREFVASIGQG